MKSSSSPALRAFDKWGPAATAGFQLVPDLLLKHQVDLELSPTEMLVLLNVLMHWWYPDQRPFPRGTRTAKRMDVQPRTVQRSLARLDELGLVKRVTEITPDGEERIVCDPEGLKRRLIQLAATPLAIDPARAESMEAAGAI